MHNIRKISFTLFIIFILLVFVEGLFSTLIVLKDAFKPIHLTSDNYYTSYDKQLGWINIPNYKNKDFYGPGIELKINSQSFRSKKSFSIKVPKNKIRVLCCGDSFTFGPGVSNDDTWCEKLAFLDNRIEPVNMGQCGYGIDQSYFWYMRDGIMLEHNVHLFTFVTDDFYRMVSDRIGIYNKPLLNVVNRTLRVNNVPVKKYPYLLLRGSECVKKLDQFRFYEFFKRVGKKINSSAVSAPDKNDTELRKIALKVFETLQETNKEKNSNLVIVYLPDIDDAYTSEVPSLRNWLRVELTKRNILYIDLYDEFWKLPFSEVHSLFLPSDPHYSKKGNEFVAKTLYKKLLVFDELNKKLTGN